MLRKSQSHRTHDRIAGDEELRSVERNGVKISFRSYGNGAPVVMLPWGGGNAKVLELSGWVKAMPGYRLVMVDHRGHGLSSKPKARSAHRIEQHRDDVIAVMDALDIEKAVVWGFSAGGNLAVAMAAKQPKRVSAIIDQDGIGDQDLCEDPRRSGRLEMARSVREKGWSNWMREVMLGDSEPTAVDKEMMGEDTEMVALQLEEWTKWRGPVSVLPRLKMPILRLVSGKNEEETIRRIESSRCENVEVQVIPGKNHGQLCGEPEHTSAVVNRFLASVTGKS